MVAKLNVEATKVSEKKLSNSPKRQERQEREVVRKVQSDSKAYRSMEHS